MGAPIRRGRGWCPGQALDPQAFVARGLGSGLGSREAARIEPGMEVKPSGFNPVNSTHDLFVVFTLDANLYALPLASVERIVPAAEINPLPNAPEIVLGIVNAQGRVIPVVDIRKRFCLPARDLALSDLLILARTDRRTVGIVADSAVGVIERSESERTPPEAIVPGLRYVEGVMKLGDGLVIIHNLDAFLSLDEERALEAAVT